MATTDSKGKLVIYKLDGQKKPEPVQTIKAYDIISADTTDLVGDWTGLTTSLETSSPPVDWTRK